jgi:two-component system, sensor histidine kinase and response regulator
VRLQLDTSFRNRQVAVMKKILVIDDDAAVQSLTVKALQSRGYQALIAADGEEGLEVARRYLPDLILCDVQMPNLDGYETLAALQRDPMTCTIPFIFLTALRDQQDMRYGMGLGADDYLTKPFTVQELVNAVMTRLAKKAAVQRLSERKLEELRGNIGLALPHELLTPLNGILGLATLLQDEQAVTRLEEVRDFARSIQSSALRLHRLIFNFIIHSELELIGSKPERVAELQDGPSTPVRAIIEATAREKAEASIRSDDLALDLEEGMVVIAPERMRKVIEELVENAFKFSHAGTPVEVQSALREDGHYEVMIRDHGRGMTSEQIASVGAHMQFERRFYEQQGTGLGLIIARRLAELHGGDLMIESVLNEGTTVRLLLRQAGDGELPRGEGQG